MTNTKEKLAIIGYIVKKLPGITKNQIGKTTIQKLIYLLTRETRTGYHYSMYHYGPYSGELSFDLNMASDVHLIDIKWVESKGYDIKINPEKEEFITKNLEGESQVLIDDILTKYGNFNAVELSLVATAYYVLDNTDVNTDEGLVTVVSSIKPEYRDRVEKVLEKAHVIPLKK
jgi:uncharacterized protein YwgA